LREYRSNAEATCNIARGRDATYAGNERLVVMPGHLSLGRTQFYAIIAALHYSHVPSDENNKVFGDKQSFVPGAPTNVQFEVKDSKKYAATGGWGFGHFNPDGKPGNAALLKTCFPCHEPAKATDLIYTRYKP
jgi:hypothetical protein